MVRFRRRICFRLSRISSTVEESKMVVVLHIVQVM